MAFFQLWMEPMAPRNQRFPLCPEPRVRQLRNADELRSVRRADRGVDAAYSRDVKNGFRHPATTTIQKHRRGPIIGSGNNRRTVDWAIPVGRGVISRSGHGWHILRG